MKKAAVLITAMMLAFFLTSCGKPSPYREGYAHGRDFKAKWDKVQNPGPGAKDEDESTIQAEYTKNYKKKLKKLPGDLAPATQVIDEEKVKAFMRGWQDAIDGKEPAE
jgi:hypothetical protein